MPPQIGQRPSVPIGYSRLQFEHRIRIAEQYICELRDEANYRLRVRQHANYGTVGDENSAQVVITGSPSPFAERGSGGEVDFRQEHDL